MSKFNPRFNPKTLTLACRTIEKGQKAREEILEAIAPAKSDIRALALELGSFAVVKAFAAKAKDELGTIDVQLENAGIPVFNVGANREWMGRLSFRQMFFPPSSSVYCLNRFLRDSRELI